MLDAAAVVLALGLADDPAAIRQRQTCLDIIVRGQAPSGGWGAYVTTATEPFDTAVVVLALADLLEAPGLAAPTVDERAGLERLIADGRSFLLAEQLDDGSWVETTRPPGQQSYAQYISDVGVGDLGAPRDARSGLAVPGDRTRRATMVAELVQGNLEGDDVGLLLGRRVDLLEDVDLERDANPIPR